MKTLSLAIIALLFFAKAYSQEPISADSTAVKLRNFFERNTHPPAVAVEDHVQGTVVIGFKVNEDRSITDIQVLKSLNPACDKEALRVFHDYRQPISLAPAEYTAGVSFLRLNKKGISDAAPFDKSPYKNFLFEASIKYITH